MAALANALSGLSLEISTSPSGSTIDLAGTSSTSAASSLSSALSSPFPSIRRLTFIVSGGKGVRGKYDLSLYKDLLLVLKDSGYKSEQEGGDESKGGSYKSQHDTGKNLKTIVVFTRPTTVEAEEEEEEKVKGGALDETSVDYKAICSSFTIFEKLVETRCPTWSEKKTLCGVLTVGQELYNILMSEVLRGKVLTSQEQNYVDSSDSFEAKLSHLKSLMQEHVKSGSLTSVEKTTLLNQVSEKILSSSQPALLKRKSLLESSPGTFAVPFRNLQLLKKLSDEIGLITKIEKGASGRLMTQKELKKVQEKEEIMVKLEEVLGKERGWWEEEDVWEERRTGVEALLKEGEKKAMKTSGGGGGKKVPVKKPVKSATSWVTPGAGKKISGAGLGRGVGGGGGAKKQQKPGGLFAAMMDSSDSDSD
ncbi:hypothetical protein TrST_g10504 [Triparma strigata]|uniref:Uncharacterized protein n=1 Tax=Triparma strigata TaxID=1606541 RepID=A0A9W7EQ36_9STRA|nr:hypothetical protein TrST_g10504 [Triparma strigata]